MLDVNGNSIIQIQAVQICLSQGRKAAHEQAYDWAREDLNVATIFPLQPRRCQRCDIPHLSISLICAKGFLKNKQEKKLESLCALQERPLCPHKHSA